jgi:3',5'-cyclic AMP phosphodiesterase CpdA
VRVAVLSDVHGNLTALEAVLADVRDRAPDLALHGGDLADAGAHPVEVIDRLRDLGWPGVRGNTDEMLFELIDDGRPQVRRVAYDVALEQEALARSRLPHAGWARILASARPEMP